MAQGLLTTADLLAATGYQRAGDLERTLRDQGVRFFRGKDGPWTTIHLINAAGGLQTYAENSDSLPMDIL